MAKDDRGFLLLKEADEPFVREGWNASIKFDGVRAQITKTSDGVVSINGRRRHMVAERFPEVIKALQDMPGSFKVDCELAAFENEFKTNLSHVQGRVHTKDPFKIRLMAKTMPVTPALFDLLELNGNDMTNRPFEERKKALSEAFSGNIGVRVVKDYDNPLEVWELAERHKLEGIVERNKGSPYMSGRTDTAIKVKRKALYPMKMVRYEVNNAGIKLFSQDGVKCQCSGHQSVEVKALIDSQGYAGVNVRGMGDKTKDGAIREPTFFGLIK